jgi:hypothetical protein
MMIHQLRAMRVRLMLHLGSLTQEARAASPPVRMPAAHIAQYGFNPIEILSPLLSAPLRHIRAQPPAVEQPGEPEVVERGGGVHHDGETFASYHDADSYLSLLLDDAALMTQKQCGDDDDVELAQGHSHIQPQPQLAEANDGRLDGADNHEPLDIEYAIAALYDDLLAQAQDGLPLSNHIIGLDLTDDMGDYAFDVDDLVDTAQMMTDDLLCGSDQYDASGCAEGEGDHLPCAADKCEDGSHNDEAPDGEAETDATAAEASSMLDELLDQLFCEESLAFEPNQAAAHD